MAYPLDTGDTNLTVDGVLKNFYRDGAAVNTTYEDHPLWALMGKKRGMANVTGRAFIHSVVYGGSQGHGALGPANSGGAGTLGTGAYVGFPLAQLRGQETSLSAKEFVIQHQINWRDFSVSTQALLSTKGDRGAFVDAVTLESDNALRSAGNDLEIYMLGFGGAIATTTSGTGSGTASWVTSGTGSRAQVGSIVGNTVVLLQAAHGVRFEVGMELDAAATDGGTPEAFGSLGHGLYVGYVDSQNGILTTVDVNGNPVSPTDAANGIPTLAANNYLSLRSDSNAVTLGLESWIPFGGPTSTLFGGVNRQVFPTRLAGNYLDGTQLSIEEIFIQAPVQQARQSNKPLTHFLLSWNTLGKLMKSQISKVAIVQDTEFENISFRGFNVYTPQGEVTVIPLRNCSDNRIYGINIDTWDYIHLGDPIQLWDFDGNEGLRQAQAEGIEYRFITMGNVVCHEPPANITIACSSN